MFEGPLVNAFILLASLLVLDKASHLTLTNSVRIADITGFGKTTIGFILVAFSTSLPALLVSIFASMGGEIGVAVGNILGSNIVNICLILALCILLATLKKTKTVKLAPLLAKEEFGSLHFGLFVASLVPLALMYIGHASKLVGVILLVIFGVYTYQLSKVRILKDEGSLGGEYEKLRKYTFWALAGVAGIVASSYFLVDSASYIALSVGVPPVVIGATIVALGTSVPLLATSVRATQRGHLGLAFGTIVGSGFINITCILGATLVASEFTVNLAAFSDLTMFSLIANLFLWYFLSSEKIGRREGGVLLFLYVIFLFISSGGYRP